MSQYPRQISQLRPENQKNRTGIGPHPAAKKGQ
jgi:hypothetical protein